MKRRFSVWTVVALTAVGLFAGMGITQLISGDSLYDQTNKLRDVFSLTERYYVEEVNVPQLTEAAINGMLAKLDPHSVYIGPRALERESEQFQGKFEGIGVQFRILNDTIMIIEPIGGGPSARLGIQSNDRIVKINDSSAIGFNETQVTQRLKGPKGTKVRVSIRRPGQKNLLDFEITRDEISIHSVDIAMMVDDETGYISANKFSQTTSEEMERSLGKLKALGMKRLVLDLRGNPGGYMEQAVRVTDLFLNGGTNEKPHTIVYTKARRSEFEESYAARSGQEYESLPLIILLGNYSASASEIVAGAIQDWDRGLIVGEPSFGKGLVQRQWKLQDGSALRLTIAKYYTPSGRLIQRAYEGKDPEEYQREAFERQEEEGENFEHKLDKGTGRDTTLPIFHTNAGRVVYGGGGITPDYIVKGQTLTPLTQALYRRDMFNQFVVSYLDGRGLDLRTKFGKDLPLFRRTFQAEEELLTSFKSFVEQHKIKFVEKEFSTDKLLIKTMLKATIARTFFGNDGWFPIRLEADPQFQKAMGLFPEAAKIARLN